MSGFFRRVLYGNERKHDFTDANLPATRREQFVYVIKNRWLKLLATNFWVFLFFLPLLLWHLCCLAYEFSFGKVTTENVAGFVEYILAYKSVPAIVCMAVAGIGLAGGIHSIRMIVWGEPIGTVRAFFRGIKYSWGQYLIGSILYGVFCVVAEVAEGMVFCGAISDKMVQIILVGALWASELLIVSLGMFSMALISNYNIKMHVCIKNSVLITISTLFRTIAFLFVSLFPTILWFVVGSVYLEFIGIVLLLLGGFAYSILVWCLYTNGVFDRYINQKDYPDYYRRGLRKEDELYVTNSIKKCP